MRRILFAFSFLVAASAITVGHSPAALAQADATLCNTVVDTTRNTVVSNSGAVIHSGTYDCPPQAVAAPEPAPAPAPAPEPNAVYFVFFDFDQATITPAAQDIVNTVINDYRRSGVNVINVVGHTDTSGPQTYNQRLSERRATAVREALVGGGVAGDSIQTSGQGETQPLVATGDGVREPSNRRAEIRFQ